jgi:uncharacterized iron-regulated membrane protein
MSVFRTVLFWLHLAAGLVAGLIIAILCTTGVALAFEKQLLAWAERDVRRIEVPADHTVRLSLAELTERVRQLDPTRPQAITISPHPRDAVAFALSRESTVYANPFTGEVRRPKSTRVHTFLRTMIEWHRWLSLSGDQRPIGKAVSGAANLAFFFLAVTGLYLWWPRSLSWRSVRAVAVFNWRLTGKSRDFNWHNSLGLWCAPVLIVLTLTALPISYRWAADGIYRLTGETPPPQGQANAPASPAPEIKRPSPDARPLSTDALWKTVKRQVPANATVTLRLGPAGTRTPLAANPAVTNGAPLPAAVTFTLREPAQWPRTATTTLWVDPFSGSIVQRESFGDFSLGRQIRVWSRYLHTGEALGLAGQWVAGLASLGGCVLVYTGFALAWRRWRARRPVPAASEVGP